MATKQNYKSGHKTMHKPKRKSVILFFTLSIILGFAVFNIVSMQIEIVQKNNELTRINSQLSDINAENEQLEHYLDEENRDEYIEQIARDELDYSYPEERIYYFVPGN